MDKQLRPRPLSQDGLRRRVTEVREAMGGVWDSPAFAPVVVARSEPGLAGRLPTEPCLMIEVEIAGAVVRVTRESDLDLLTAVARALKAAA